MMRRGADRLVLVATLLVIAVLVGLAVLVTVTHQQAIQDVQKRFHDRAAVSASVTQAVFSVSLQGMQAQANAALGGRRISPKALRKITSDGSLAYAEVLDDHGRVLASTPNAPRQRVLSHPAYVRQASGGTAAFSDVYGSPDSSDQVVEWAIPFSVNPGRRVEILAIRVSRLSDLVASILSRLPTLRQGDAALIDSKGMILGSPTPGLNPGDHLPDAALLKAATGASQGDYTSGGMDRRFASSRLAGTPWKVVLAADHDVLYAEANGARRTVPWVVFALLALVAIAGLFLLRRATRASADIARREASRRYALEINDNVIQRLTVAKLAMETGHEEVGLERISETLREAQRLVSELIGDRELESGDLRRSEKVTSS
jgi:hypothetical protein